LRLLIVDSYYPYFLKSFYKAHPEVKSLPYAGHWQSLMSECFGTADFYSSNLKELGHEAHEVIVNNEELQRQWAIENGVKLHFNWFPFDLERTRLLLKIIHDQARRFSPDVLYVQSINWLPADSLKDIKRYVRLIVGQHASPLPKGRYLQGYDLILSSLPNQVAYFREQGVASEYFRLGFEQKVLSKLSKSFPPYDAVHIGGYSPIHEERNAFLESVSHQVKIDYWGYGMDNVSQGSPIRQNYHGEAWGIAMYNIRHNSRICLNKHITSVANGFCNNLTLYEATGVGTLLITDYKGNLPELFEPGREVLAYKSPEECSELVKHYLEHEDERLAIAWAGQQRTLREHTYFHRMQELIDILNRYLHKPQAGTRRIFNS